MINKFTRTIHNKGWTVTEACEYWNIHYDTYNKRCNNDKFDNQLISMCRGLENKLVNMQISEIEFTGAKYHDLGCGLYLDELPDGHYKKDNDIYVKTSEHYLDYKSKEIVKMQDSKIKRVVNIIERLSADNGVKVNLRVCDELFRTSPHNVEVWDLELTYNDYHLIERFNSNTPILDKQDSCEKIAVNLLASLFGDYYASKAKKVNS